ncbi:DUF3093 domain-containing protein [Microbacterium sp. EF45047]|nr:MULTISPECIES: DUF3093 domain-containing protein [Microbacterium]UWF78660.1 DUF3093 domain-containing protein [Microbacterium neungamense]WCM54647.1 DUF3093 domain-containing protein [Microbacterium sp. EF45047]
MQNHERDTRPLYRERLAPGLWLLVTIALAGPMTTLVFLPAGSTTLALVIGVLVSLLLVVASIAFSPVVAVADGELRAGRAHIDAGWLGEPEVYTGEEARARRGPRLPGDGWHLIRGGIDGLVVVPITDPADPVRSWSISTRTPDRLAAAIRRAAGRPGR